MEREKQNGGAKISARGGEVCQKKRTGRHSTVEKGGVAKGLRGRRDVQLVVLILAEADAIARSLHLGEGEGRAFGCEFFTKEKRP